MANQSKNKLVVPGAKAAIDNMKAEIANELGVQMGADATARQNGTSSTTNESNKIKKLRLN